MYLIVGLGNPEPEYSRTRHNMGFDVINEIAKRQEIELSRTKFNGIYGSGIVEEEKVILLKPQTFMNLSGESIRALADYYKIDYERELIVVSDDINLPPGQIRIRKSGSAGGHNGLKDIIRQLGSENFQRIRIGVGEKPKGYDLADYVLGHFSKEERPLMKEGLLKAVKAALMMLDDETDRAMNEYNRKVSPQD